MVRFVSLFHLLRFCISTWPVLHISSMWFTITPSRVKSLFVGLSNSSNFCCQRISLHEGLSCFLKQQDQVSVKLWPFFDLLNFCTFCHLCIQNSPHHPASQWHLFLVSLSKSQVFVTVQLFVKWVVWSCVLISKKCEPDFGIDNLPITLWMSRPSYDGFVGS